MLKTLKNAPNQRQVTVADIITEGSYLFYEMRDVQVTNVTKDPNLGLVKYSKLIHPLFSPGIVNAKFNQSLLSLIFEETPFYYLAPNVEHVAGKVTLPATRDIGINNVPSPLRTNFWEVWHREIQGFFTNNLLLDIFNKLRYPYIDEHQYMNAKLFPKLANQAFSSSDSEGQVLEFKTTPEENFEDIQRGDIGCLDYLDDIVQQKLSSSYAIIDYKPDQADLLSAWSESMYLSGKLDLDELQKEQTIYRLQDIKYELLRRKFAGSFTLYNLALASINKRGSFVRTVAIGDVYTSSVSKTFRDTRFARVLNIPGVLTKPVKLDNLHPFEYFYENKIGTGKEVLPLDVVTPLYYTSAPQSFGSADEEWYNAENFYLAGNATNNVYKYRADRLRGNSTSLNWNVPTSPFSSEAFNEIYNVLDTYTIDESTVSGRIYRTLDSSVTVVKPDGSEEVVKNKLDIKTPSISSSVTTGNVLDVNADTILYHKNSLQKSLSDSYPYATYSIANGNSLSLMDIPWMQYLRKSTEDKSRVQDNITFGTQISRYEQVPDSQQAETTFFAISYGDDRTISDDMPSINIASVYDIPIYSYQEWLDDFGVTPKYAYLWMITINYDIDSFYVAEDTTGNVSPDIKATLFSKITLRIDANLDKTNPYKDLFKEVIVNKNNVVETLYSSEFDQIDEFVALKDNHIGLLPFSYKELKNSKVAALKYGIYEKDGNKSFIDDISDLGYSKAIFAFSSSDLMNYSNSQRDPLEALKNADYLTSTPSDSTKSVYFIVARKQRLKETSKVETTYTWSEPIRVLNLSKTHLGFSGNYTIKPDWYHLCYHLNPELNFNPNNASPLRNKEVYRAPITSEKLKVKGPSSVAALSNLTRTRHMDFLCNDAGEDRHPWVNWESEEVKKYLGFYLYHYHDAAESTSAAQKPPVVVDVFGDNRQSDFYDETPGERYLRSEVYVSNSTQKHGLRFANSSILDESTEPAKLNYFQLLPKHPTLIKTSDWKKWWWNQPTLGKAMFFNLELDIATLRDATNKSLSQLQAKYDEDSSALQSFTDVVEHTTYTLAYRKNDVYLRLECTAIRKLISKELPEGQHNVELAYAPSQYSFVAKLDVYRNNQVLSCQSTSIPFKTVGLLSSNFRIAVSLAAPVFPDKQTRIAIIIGDLMFEKSYNIEVVEQPILNYGIDLFSKLSSNKKLQEEAFKGVIYDFRIYNEGFSKENLLLLNKGSAREQFSDSSSIIRLGYNIYKDLGVLKKVSRFKSRKVLNADSLPKVTAIRVFNRDNWDTRLVDMYPNSKEEYLIQSPFYTEDIVDPKSDTDIFGVDKFGNYFLQDAIQQDLVESVEVVNNINPGMKAEYEQSISYNGQQPIPLRKSDLVTIVMSSLYPVVYNNTAFTSSAKLEMKLDGSISTVSGYPIDIPVSAIGGSLRYQADLNMNFIMDTTSDFSIWYSRGSNITRTYNENLKASVASVIDRSLRGADNNHILIPLTIPEQENVLTATTGTLDRFYLKGAVLNYSINDLLKATSYYNELRIPVAQVNYAGQGEYVYASKWDAIRTLKEGAYYITCKYPFQLLPFTDEEYNKSNDLSYATQYASCRFKIIVKGKPVEYKTDQWAIKGTPEEYNRSMLTATLESPAGLVRPINNRAFPHRQLDIDLYVMDKLSIAGIDNSACDDYKWTLLASNHIQEKDIIFLDSETLSESLVTKKDIPLFFSRDYTSPFFVASKNEDGSYDATTPSSNLNEPVEVKVIYNQDNLKAEKLSVSSVDELDQLTVVSGRSYKLLFDLDAKIPEISYSDDTVALEVGKFITPAELVTYARMHDIKDPTFQNQSSFMYTLLPDWSSKELSNITARTSGFATIEDGWKSKATENGDEFYFGNPYSKSSSSNYLLSIGLSRTAINRSAVFPYTATEVLPGTFISSAIRSQVDALDRGRTLKGGLTYSPGITLNEVSLLKKHLTSQKAIVTNSFSELTSHSSGIITQFSKIAPNLHYREGDNDADDKMAKYTKIRTLARDLFAYHADFRSIPYRNGNLQVTTKSLFKNNLFTSQDFTDKSKWVANKAGEFVAEDKYDVKQEGKDVFEVMLSAGETYTLEYLTSDTSYNNVYEVALSVKAPVTVTAVFKQGTKETRYPMQALEIAQNGSSSYRVFSVNTKDFVQATTIMFEIQLKAKSSKQLVAVRFTKAVARIATTTTHKLGLYDALFVNNPTNVGLITTPHSIVAFKKKNSSEYLPVQFENRISSRNINGTSMSVSYVDNPAIQEFISSNSLGFLPNNSKVEALIQPWIRRLQFWESYNTGGALVSDSQERAASKTVIRRYMVGVDEQGVKRVKLESGISHDVYSEAELKYDGTSNIEIVSLRLNLVDGDPQKPAALASYNTNLKLSNSYIEGQDLPLTISNERFSALTNCFNPAQYKQGDTSKVVITNIQLLGKTEDKKDEVLYELEYLPLIYDELQQHVSFNIFLHRSRA